MDLAKKITMIKKEDIVTILQNSSDSLHKHFKDKWANTECIIARDLISQEL